MNGVKRSSIPDDNLAPNPEEELTRLLATLPRREPGGTLRRRILDIVPQSREDSVPYWPFPSFWQPALFLASCMIFGVVLGWQGADEEGVVRESSYETDAGLLVYGPDISGRQWDGD
ncbi:MAG: hypothetical protein HQL56_00370 [Magnetococcales bacterium]|nr:hypothetical protein [Magnetococcales bacterium]